jgi:hypothetical protein
MPVHHTRRAVALDSNADGIQVGRTAQFLPVILFFMEELLLSSKALKTDIECGVSDNKDTVKQVKEAVQREKERWKTEKEKAGGKPVSISFVVLFSS